MRIASLEGLRSAEPSAPLKVGGERAQRIQDARCVMRDVRLKTTELCNHGAGKAPMREWALG